MPKAKKKTNTTPDTLEYAPGSTEEILLNLAYDNYQRSFTSDGEMVIYDKHKNITLKIPNDTLYYMEIIYGYEMME
jgi:hypothetical protein